MSRGFFHLDATFATILVVIIMTISLHSITSFSRGFSTEGHLAKHQLETIQQADFLLKKCADEGGLAYCEGKTVFSHVVEKSHIDAIEVGKICASRLVVTKNGDETVIRVCA